VDALPVHELAEEVFFFARVFLTPNLQYQTNLNISPPAMRISVRKR